MDRNVRALMIALLCVLAVSLAASTLVNPESPSGAGPGIGEDVQSGSADRSGDGGSESAQDLPEGGEPIRLGAPCIPILLSPAVIAGGIAVLVGTGWVLKRRENLPYALAVMFPLTLFLGVPYLLLTNCGNDVSMNPQDAALLPEMSSNNSTGGDLGGQAGGQAVEQLVSPPVLVGLLVVVAVVFALLAYRASGDDDADGEAMPEAPTGEPEDRNPLAAVGTAAGEAADRIEDAADVDNEVYRAWRDMTDHVDVPDPETSTPREFATAARDAGMDGTHVDALTDLFRDVRYGGAAATEDREERAVDALRAIEDRYAEGGGE